MLDILFPPRRRASAGENLLDPDVDTGWGVTLSTLRNWLSALPTTSGVRVNEEVALTYSACWCATRVLCETAAGLPLLLYERTDDDGREVARDHPLYTILHDQPNPEMGSMAFREGRTHHQVNWGNGFAEIEWDSVVPERRSRVLALHPIHPSRVSPLDPANEEYRSGYRYAVANDDGTAALLKPDEMLHVPGVIPEDGIWAKGVIRYARESLGSSLATERHVATSFGPGNLPRGVLFLPGSPARDPEARKALRKEWKEVHGSATAADIAILPAEGKFEKFDFSNEDAQFILTRQHNVEEVARWYRVPPHLIMHLLRSTYSNIDQQSIEFVIYSLLPWLRRWEEQINLKLLLPRERKRYYAEHQVAGLLRGDLGSRFAAYVQAIQNGFMSINEVRRLENMNPVPGGDKYLVQLNMTTLENAGQPPAPAPTLGGQAQDAAKMTDFDRLTRRMARLERRSRQKVEAPALPPPPRKPTVPREAALAVLEDACRRILSRTTNAAKRKAKDPDFEDWLKTHVAESKASAKGVLAASAAVLSADKTVTAGELAEYILSVMHLAIVQAYASDTRQQFADRLDNWSVRAREVAEEVLNVYAAEEKTHAL